MKLTVGAENYPTRKNPFVRTPNWMIEVWYFTTKKMTLVHLRIYTPTQWFWSFWKIDLRRHSYAWVKVSICESSALGRNLKFHPGLIKWDASSRWSPSLYFLMRNSDQMTIVKTHPTLITKNMSSCTFFSWFRTLDQGPWFNHPVFYWLGWAGR